ncbi:histone deacetylase complex subunit SAP30L-like [Paramuricea clavata]|uniref:Histone deacetylase complex subunit SAP30L-like n=1 Tax=Paramuricea clavata TaxID=317549 RepID=A0A6S7HBP7_PARCT|nr:histone deacetylase complex subunit SAP30L-like [Paramuricea clavata]
MNGYQSESEDNSPKPHRVCCLIEDKDRCKRLAGNACYSKRIQKTVAQKKLKLAAAESAGHIYICNYHKDMIQTARSKRKRKDSEDENDGQEVDVSILQTSTLRRYKRHFKLQTRPGLNKTQLVEVSKICTGVEF